MPAKASRIRKRNGNAAAAQKRPFPESGRRLDTEKTKPVISSRCWSRPAQWPDDVHFLASQCQPSKRVSAELAVKLCVAPRPDHPCHPFSVRAHDWTVVQLITPETPCKPPFNPDEHAWSSSYDEKEHRSHDKTLRSKPVARHQHPALGQCGLFARRDIPPRTLVVPYLGLAHLAQDDDEDKNSCYDAAIEVDQARCGIDATHEGSEARFVNDYRGILQRPNLFFDEWKAAFPRECVVPVSWQSVKDDVKSLGSNRKKLRPSAPPAYVFGLALYSGAHPIKAGTELCASYGKGWWAARRDIDKGSSSTGGE